MPAYDFRCKVCAETIEVTRPASDDSPVACPACGGETKRVFTPVGVHFKGSGFHNTDNRKKAAPQADAPACDAAGSKPACEGCPASSD